MGETGLAVTARVLPAWLDIVNAHSDACVVAAFHKAAMRALVSPLLGLDSRVTGIAWSRNLAAVTIVEFRDPPTPVL